MSSTVHTDFDFISEHYPWRQCSCTVFGYLILSIVRFVQAPGYVCVCVTEAMFPSSQAVNLFYRFLGTEDWIETYCAAFGGQNGTESLEKTIIEMIILSFKWTE